MSAKILSISRKGASRAVTPEQEQLASALKGTTLGPLEDLVADMFTNADDMIFGMVEMAQSDQARRSMLEALRAIRLSAARVKERFILEVLRSFQPEPDDHTVDLDDLDFSSLTLQASDALEIKIAVDNIATKARSLHMDAIRDYELKLAVALRGGHLFIHEKALSPESISGAFRSAFDTVDSDIETKLVVLKLFERAVISRLGDTYKAASAVLEPVAKGAGHSRPKPKKDPDETAGLTAQVDSVLHRSRKIFGGDAVEAESSQGLRELQSALTHFFKRNGSTSMAEVEERLIAAQSIISQRLTGVAAESPERQAIERLRVAVCIAALDEDGPLTDANRLARVAGILGVGATRGGAAVPAGAGRGVVYPGSAEVVDPELVRGRERDRLIKTIRAEVARDVNAAIGERLMSLRAVRFVESKLSLLLSIHRLRSGNDSPSAVAARDLVLRIINVLVKHQSGTAVPEMVRAKLEKELEFAFSDIGMDAGSVRNQLRDFASLVEEIPAQEMLVHANIRAGDKPEDAPAIQEIRTPATAETVPDDSVTVGSLLPKLLRPGIWFRVYDVLTDSTRWMELDSYHATQGVVTFSGFSGSDYLSMSTRRLVDDLVDGRTESTSTTPEAVGAMKLIASIVRGRKQAPGGKEPRIPG